MFTLKGLKSIREKAGYTQESLARELKISTAVLSKWEQGKGFPRKDNLSKLVSHLRCSYDDLLNGVKDE